MGEGSSLSAAALAPPAAMQTTQTFAIEAYIKYPIIYHSLFPLPDRSCVAREKYFAVSLFFITAAHA